MNVTHSKLPWKVVEWANRDRDGAVEVCGYEIVDADNYLVSASTVEDEGEENLAFIVKAVNAHDKLVEAARKAQASLWASVPVLKEHFGLHKEAIDTLNEALAAAGEQV